MNYALCPSCDEKIRISGKPYIGLSVTCPSCGDDLEVVQVDPIELDWVFYDDDEDDDSDWDYGDVDEEEDN